MELSTVMLLASLSAASTPAAPGNSTPVIVVRGPERLICRPVTRTGTRIGTHADCRPREDPSRAGHYASMDEAQAKLEVIGADCGCE